MAVTVTQGQKPEIAAMPGPQGQAPAGPRSADRRDLAAALRPLLVDVGIPVGTYYLLRNAFGVSLWLSLALSSIGPAVRAAADHDGHGDRAQRHHRAQPHHRADRQGVRAHQAGGAVG